MYYVNSSYTYLQFSELSKTAHCAQSHNFAVSLKMGLLYKGMCVHKLYAL